MIYGELGVMPLAVDIQTRMISFWAKLIQTEQDEIYKLSPFIYKMIYALHNDKVLISQWVDSLKHLSAHLDLEAFGIHRDLFISNGSQKHLVKK